MEKKGRNGGGIQLIRRGETAAGAAWDVIEQAKSGTRRKQGNEDSSSGTTQTRPEGRRGRSGSEENCSTKRE